MHKVVLTGLKNDLSIKDILDIAENNHEVGLSQVARERIIRGRKKLEEQLRNRPEIPIYGTNVLHGDLKDIDVNADIIELYQIKYIKVHNCGTGNPLPLPIVRAMMVIRLNSFARGLSGMRIETCDMLLQLLNKGVTPEVLEEGSVGASGDLVPLAMIGAAMIGLDEAIAYYGNKRMSANDALAQAGIFKIVLGAKEAMGLTNGVNFIAALAAFSLRDAKKLLKTASLSAALSLEAIRGETRAFSELINEDSNRHDGQIAIAQQIRKLIEGSKRCTKKSQEITFGDNDKAKERVQDRYSFRCVPQVHGALYEAIEKLEATLTREVNSATDNPLFDFDKVGEDGGILFSSGGNFHGQPLASPIDYLKIALTSVGLITDKRTFSLLDCHLNFGLPADLAKDTSKADGGYMIAQYAGAARAAENRVLSTPASVMSISTAANQEDFVSMGSIGAIHLRKIIYNCEIIVAIELLCAVRALQLSYNNLPDELQPLGTHTSIAYEKLKDLLGEYTEDNYLKVEIDKVVQVIRSGDLINATGEAW